MKLKFVSSNPSFNNNKELADYHASEYSKAVKNANLIMTSSICTVGITESNVSNAYKLAFDILGSTDPGSILPPLNPNYKGDSPNLNQGRDQSIIEGIFKPVAAAICLEWMKEKFTAGTVPPGYVSPITGYQVLVPGDPDALSKDLARAFFISQTETDGDIAVNNFIEALSKAYITHLTKISGIFVGNIPAAPSPVPGPPFPFIGVI